MIEKTEPRSVRIIIEVGAGLIPGQAYEPETVRRFPIYSDEWHEANDEEKMTLLDGAAHHAEEWARGLRNPGRFNWVRVDWVYF